MTFAIAFSMLALAFSVVNFWLLIAARVAPTESAPFIPASFPEWERAEWQKAVANDSTPTPCGVHHPSPSDMKAADKVRAEYRRFAVQNPYSG